MSVIYMDTEVGLSVESVCRCRFARIIGTSFPFGLQSLQRDGFFAPQTV